MTLSFKVDLHILSFVLKKTFVKDWNVSINGKEGKRLKQEQREAEIDDSSGV